MANLSVRFKLTNLKLKYIQNSEGFAIFPLLVLLSNVSQGNYHGDSWSLIQTIKRTFTWHIHNTQLSNQSQFCIWNYYTDFTLFNSQEKRKTKSGIKNCLHQMLKLIMKISMTLSYCLKRLAFVGDYLGWKHAFKYSIKII